MIGRTNYLAIVAFALVLVVGGVAEAAPIAVTNHSFENPAYASPGGSGLTHPGWTDLGGNAGTGRTATSQYPGGIPDGVNYAWFNQAADTLGQTLATTLQPNTTYTLTVATGWRADLAPWPNYPGYRIELWAGGTMLGFDADTTRGGTGTGPAAGTWKDVTATYTSPSSVPANALEIRLLAGNAVNSGTAIQTNYDNVRLDGVATSPPPPVGGVLLSDDFTVSRNDFDANFEISRQTGQLAPITYTQAGAANHHQVGNGGSPGRLLIAATNTSNFGRVSPDHNFTENPGVGGYSFIRFDVDPVTASSAPFNPVQSSWAAITLGTSLAGRNQFVNASDGFGILFRGNGGFQAFDGTTNLGGGTYTTSPAGLHPIEVRVSDPTDGNPWDGVGFTTINVFADGSSTPFYTFTKGAGGYASNYITLEGDSDNGALTIHDFDNFSIGTVVIPEPATIAVWGLLGMCWAGVSGWRRRRNGLVELAETRQPWTEENRNAIREMLNQHLAK
jgi:hypothetical protein